VIDRHASHDHELESGVTDATTGIDRRQAPVG
jgi:hypothetical protein